MPGTDLREIAMPQHLERLLAELGRAPLDHSLDSVAGDVGQKLAETSAVDRQTWRLRAAAMLFVTLSGVAASVVSSAAVAAEPSPFAAWSNLAPSTLLERGK
jgi:hypothetical protein